MTYFIINLTTLSLSYESEPSCLKTSKRDRKILSKIGHKIVVSPKIVLRLS